MDKTAISGLGVVAVSAGAVLIWSGIQNRPILDSLRDLAAGRPVAPGEQKRTGTVPAGAAAGTGSARGGSVLANAEALKGQRYVFGAGHGATFCTSTSDCSSYVSCVLHKAGLLNGRPLTTDGLARWGKSVKFSQRAPGDVLVWRGGPGGGHCGIVIDGSRMWHQPCTGCGGVQIGRYGSTRTGRPTLVRRAN